MSKRKLSEEPSESSAKVKKQDDSPITSENQEVSHQVLFKIEELFAKFPKVGTAIFSQLNNQDLVGSKKVNQAWASFISKQKLPWIQMIRKYIGTMEQIPESWDRVVVRTPFQTVKDLALVVQEVQKNPLYEKISANFHQCSPLHVAAACGNLQLCQHVIKKNCKMPFKNKVGLTPFHFAALYGHSNVFNFIIQNNDITEMNPANDEGFTPLHYAAKSGQLEICTVIIENVKDKNPANNKGVTPLYMAVANGHLEICRLIVGNVDNKNPANNQGFTPLFIAAKNGHIELLKLIISFGGQKTRFLNVYKLILKKQ